MTGRLIRKLLTAVLMLLIGLLVVQALGYGIGFAMDPESGVQELGGEEPSAVEDLTVALVGWVGVAMLGFAALLILSAILIWRADRAGAHVTTILGGIYVLVGMRAFRAEWWWDAYFYSVTGALLVVLSLAVGWLQSRVSGETR